MKPFSCFSPGLCLLLGVVCLGALPLAAQTEAPVYPPPPAQPADPLEQIVAPIALYPDVLVALILPASTVSSDVGLAANYLNAGGGPGQLDAQPWDDSVRSLAHYPELVRWMNENLDWTEELGNAYLDRPDDVMAAIQRVRARARINGMLVDTPEQQVVIDGDYIRIIPAQPDMIYLPRYDADDIYMDEPGYYEPGSFITFGIGFSVGAWLSYDCDWGHHMIWIDHYRREHWRDVRDWRHPHFPGRPDLPHDSHWNQWRPPPGRPRPVHQDVGQPHRGIVRPKPLAGAPHLDRGRSNEPRRLQPGERARPTRPPVNAADRNGLPPSPPRPVVAPAAGNRVPPSAPSRKDGGDDHRPAPEGHREIPAPQNSHPVVQPPVERAEHAGAPPRIRPAVPPTRPEAPLPATNRAAVPPPMPVMRPPVQAPVGQDRRGTPPQVERQERNEPKGDNQRQESRPADHDKDRDR